MQASYENFGSRMLQMQCDMQSDINDIKRRLSEACMISPQDLQGMESVLLHVRVSCNPRHIVHLLHLLHL
jgi:hypothetical protein